MAFDLSSAKPVPDEPKKSGFDLSSAKDVPTVDKIEALMRGFSNAATLGMAPRISAAANTGLGKLFPDTFGTESYDQRLSDYLAADKAAREQQPVASLAGNIVGGLPMAIASGGGSLARQVGTNAAMAGLTAAGGQQDLMSGNTAAEAAKAAVTGGALAAVPAAAVKGVSAAQDYTKKKITENLTGVLNARKNMPTKEWHSEVRKATGLNEGESLRDGFRDVPTRLKTMIGTVESAPNLSETKAIWPAATDAQLSDFSKEARAMVNYTPGIKESLLKTTKDAALTGAAVGGASELLGENSPVDFWEAAALGAAGGAFGGGGGGNLLGIAGRNLGSFAQGTIGRLGTSKIPEAVLDASLKNPMTSSAIQGTVAQIGAAEATEGNNFKKLSEYLSQLPEEERRKKAMELQSTAEGRASINSDSPLNK